MQGYEETDTLRPPNYCQGEKGQIVCVKAFVSTTTEQRHGKAGDLHGLAGNAAYGEETI